MHTIMIQGRLREDLDERADLGEDDYDCPKKQPPSGVQVGLLGWRIKHLDTLFSKAPLSPHSLDRSLPVSLLTEDELKRIQDWLQEIVTEGAVTIDHNEVFPEDV